MKSISLRWDVSRSWGFSSHINSPSGSDEKFITIHHICLTQTYIQPSAEPHSALLLEEFQMVYNNNAETFQSITILTLFYTLNCGSYIKIKKWNRGDTIFRLLLLYKKNAILVTIFCNWLENFLKSTSFDLISGDFDINASRKREGWYRYYLVMIRLLKNQLIFLVLYYFLFIFIMIF